MLSAQKFPIILCLMFIIFVHMHYDFPSFNADKTQPTTSTPFYLLPSHCTSVSILSLSAFGPHIETHSPSLQLNFECRYSCNTKLYPLTLSWSVSWITLYYGCKFKDIKDKTRRWKWKKYTHFCSLKYQWEEKIISLSNLAIRPQLYTRLGKGENKGEGFSIHSGFLCVV